MKRSALIFLGGLVLGLAPLSSRWSAPAGAEDIAAAESSSIAVPECRVKLIDQVTLASGQNGILAFVEPREGDMVGAKQQIAGLKDEIARAALAVADAKAKNDVPVRYGRKAAEVAAAEHQKALLANRRQPGAIPEVEVLKLKLAAAKGLLETEKAEKELHQAELERDQAQAELDALSIEAPFEGVVTRVFKQKGEAVRQGDPVLELANIERMRVEGYVDLEHIWKVKRGMPVSVRLNIPDADLPVEQKTFEGRIVFVDVSVQVSGKVRVWAEVLNRDRILRAGLRATMTIFPEDQSTAKTAKRR